MAAGELQQRIALQIVEPGQCRGRGPGDVQCRLSGAAGQVDRPHRGVAERRRGHRRGGGKPAVADVEITVVGQGAAKGQTAAAGVAGAEDVVVDLDQAVVGERAAGGDLGTQLNASVPLAGKPCQPAVAGRPAQLYARLGAVENQLGIAGDRGDAAATGWRRRWKNPPAHRPAERNRRSRWPALLR